MACFESPSNQSESPIILTWTDLFLGKRVSLRLNASGIPLPPAEQRAHIMRPLELMQAAAWFFARRWASRHISREPLSLGFMLREYYSMDLVRFMTWLVPATCLRLSARASAGSAMHLARLVMDRVSRRRAGKVQVRLR